MTRLTSSFMVLVTLVVMVGGDGSAWGANETRTMECENYVVVSKFKEKRSFFTIKHIVGSSEVEVKLKSNDNSVHPPESSAWNVLWKSEDNMRLVAVLTQVPKDNSFESPILTLDIDYQKPWYRQVNLGGFLENNTTAGLSPWKRICKRLD